MKAEIDVGCYYVDMEDWVFHIIPFVRVARESEDSYCMSLCWLFWDINLGIKFEEL